MPERELIRKYNVPGPRYTSYPTVPYWSRNPDSNSWKQSVREAFHHTNSTEGISLYIHLPYCESLCTFCACNKRITKNHGVEGPYIEAVLSEWKTYGSLFEERPLIREIHLGGGTPTFFQPENLQRLIEGIFKTADRHSQASFGFEAHPKNTSRRHLETLAGLGFDRLSLGIQDFDPTVQEIINRIQPYEMVKEVVDNARDTGYGSINFDLVYGLPLQTLTGVGSTIEQVINLDPDRIAYYSYAHVPWVRSGQRRFTEADLPADEEKRALYELGKSMFEAAGLLEIGMDHFAKPEDELSIAMKKGTLHRNFMGYTPFHTTLMIGLGVSSISDSWDTFIQNEKKVEDYMERALQGEIPLFRGHVLNAEDMEIRRHILDLMCRFHTEFGSEEDLLRIAENGIPLLRELEADGLIELSPREIRILPGGSAFVRNVCMALDKLLLENQPGQQVFSKTI